MKLFVGNGPQYCLHGMWATPAPPVGGHCSILNSFVNKGLINVGFVTTKNATIFLPFFPPSSPLFLSFSFLLYNCDSLLSIDSYYRVLALFPMLYNTSLSSSDT